MATFEEAFSKVLSQGLSLPAYPVLVPQNAPKPVAAVVYRKANREYHRDLSRANSQNRVDSATYDGYIVTESYPLLQQKEDALVNLFASLPALILAQSGPMVQDSILTLTGDTYDKDWNTYIGSFQLIVKF